MPIVRELPTPAAREQARQQSVTLIEKVSRQVLALGLLGHPQGQQLAARITAGELLPRVEVRLSGPGLLLVVWADLADEMGPPLWLFAAGDLGDLGEPPDLEGNAPHPGSSKLN